MINTTFAAMALAVFVTGADGNVAVWDSIPNITPYENEYHVEVVRGYVTDDDGCGALVMSTDGPIESAYNYISYVDLPVVYGDAVTSVFVLECDSDGNWEDDAIMRCDIIDGVTLDMVDIVE